MLWDEEHRRSFQRSLNQLLPHRSLRRRGQPLSFGWRVTIAMEDVAQWMVKVILVIRVICSLLCALDLAVAGRHKCSTTEDPGFYKAQGGPHAAISTESCAVMKKPHLS